MKDWIKVLEIDDLIRANVANAALHAANVDTAFINHKDSALVFLGRYDIYVRPEDESRAQAILDEIDDRDYEAEMEELEDED